jgi:hypothetical protein
LGKTGNKGFDSASQHFFCAEGKFPQRVLATSLATLTRGVEPEQLLSFFNDALAFDARGFVAEPT